MSTWKCKCGAIARRRRCKWCGSKMLIENEAEKRAHIEDEMRVEFEDELQELVDEDLFQRECENPNWLEE